MEHNIDMACHAFRDENSEASASSTQSSGSSVGVMWLVNMDMREISATFRVRAYTQVTFLSTDVHDLGMQANTTWQNW